MLEIDISAQQILQKVIENGLENACISFSALIRKSVHFNKNELQIKMGDNEIKSLLTRTIKNQYVITTKLIGELEGSSYLLLTDEESDEIFNYASSAINEDDQKHLKIEFLKEIDNIISATVITEFSNSFGIRLLGGVPQLDHLDNQQFREKLHNELFQNAGSPKIYLITSSSFIINEQLKLQPLFVWQLEDKVLSMALEYTR